MKYLGVTDAVKFVSEVGVTDAGLFVSGEAGGRNAGLFVEEAGETVALEFVKAAGGENASKFMRVASEKVAPEFVKAAGGTLAGNLVQKKGATNAGKSVRQADSVELLAEMIKASYELGINDAPLIKQGIHQIDNSTYIVNRIK